MRSLRKGYSLVELLAVLSVFSVALTTIVLTLHGLQKSGDRVRANLDVGVQQGRFVHQLRTDAHAAQALVTSPSDNGAVVPTVLQLTLPDQQTIEYRLHADQIERLVRTGDMLQHRESYRVVPIVAQGWTTVTDGVRPLITVHLQRSMAGLTTVHQNLPSWRVDAVLGLLSPEDTRPTAESMP